jgi:hypothetical protein
MPTKTWVVGEEVLAADWNTYVQEQVVATFANAAARTTAIAAPKPGMLTWLIDVKRLELYDGTAWREYGAARGRIASKKLTGNLGTLAAFNDISAGGLTVSHQVGRIYRIAVWLSVYLVSHNAQITIQINRAVPPGGTQTMFVQEAGRILTDLAQFAFWKEETATVAQDVQYLTVAGSGPGGGTVATAECLMDVYDIGHT